MDITVDAMIPSSVQVPMSLNKGVPVVLDQPDAQVSRSIRQLAGRLTDTPVDEESGAADANGKKKRRLFARG